MTPKGRSRPRKTATPGRFRPWARRRAWPEWLKTLFAAVGVPAVLFLSLELVLAAFGVRPVLYEEDPYVGFASHVPLFVEQTRADRTSVMVTAPNKLRLFNAQQFSKNKSAHAFRIFCLGGSTTYGRPYTESTSFCGWLRELLPEVDVSRNWEVINAGGVSYASYRTALLMEELLQYEPDLFIVYSGHNEFLEERTYGSVIATPRAVRGLGALASSTRTYSALRKAVRSLRPASESQNPQTYELASEVRTRLDASVGPEAYTRDDEQREKILRHYRFNLARMVDIARSADADIVLVTPAANLRHSSPFKSTPSEGLAESEIRLCQTLLETAEAARAAGRLEDALIALDQALQIDERQAELHFSRGRVLDGLGRYSEAKAAFEQARDEDVCPLRAPRQVREIVAEVAAGRGVALVDFIELLEARSPQGVPGEEDFFDHVHPKIELHRLLALELLEIMRREGILRAASSWDDATVDLVSARIEGRVDRLSHAKALLNLSKVLGWAGKLEEAGRLAVMATQTAPELAEAYYQAGQCAQLSGEIDQAIGYYRKTLELAPDVATAHGNLAAALEKKGQTLQAIFHYRRAIALLGEGNSAYRQRLAESLLNLGATPGG